VSTIRSQAREHVYQWVLLDLPVDTLISLRTSLEWHVAEPRDDGPPTADLDRVLTEVNQAIEARTTLQADRLAAWQRLVRDGLSAREAILVTTGIFIT
jgi:hypothetical protein